MSRRLAVVVKGWPRLSETFIANEIAGLEARGFEIHLVSLRAPASRLRHPVHEVVKAPVTYLPEALLRAPRRLWRAWRLVRRLPGYRAAKAALKGDLEHLAGAERRHRRRRFGQAVIMAAELPSGTPHIHVHFLHTPASVGRYAALMHGIGYSLSAHARDIWTSPAWDLKRKMEGAAFTICCTRHGSEALQALSLKTVHCQHHGIALDDFWPAAASARDGTDPRDPVRLLCVARLVEKKGHEDLLAALAQLPDSLSWHLDLIGDGPAADRLAAQARALKLDGRVIFHGAQAQPAVAAAYAAADIAVLAARIAADGDRDGLPNVLVEAQGAGLPVVATRLSAIPELVGHEVSGLLVEPGDRAGLARAVAALIVDPARRRALGAQGAARVAASFDAQAGFDRLAALLKPLVVGR